MTLDTDDEILQDFLVEAEEILEGLNEQLVELENSPQDKDLLNSIFRGFHTIKGGAGFLSLEAMVNLCHKGEDVFNLLRQGERYVDADMMDTFLKVLDILNTMFDELKSGQYPTAADPAILSQLAAYLDNSSEAYTPPQQATPEPAPEPEPEAAPAADATASNAAADDEITDDEFEALLDQLHGNAPPGSKTEPEQPEQPVPAAPESGSSDSDDITEEEFEALLDQLQGKSQKPAANKAAAQQAASAPRPEPAKADPAPQQPAAVPNSQASQADTTKPEAKAEPKPEPAAKTAAPAKQADTSVRVDTSRLDDIMNMVGELVLVRNRISTLEAAFENEEMAKAVNNLTVVTGDLQTAVMKTRMQPIKKVFGRFPRVVRDLARSLKKDINLELRGEETDLDKNLVEALADPLVHLVRNAVDHGIEMPDEREAAGKPRQGNIVLAAAQEGDHILLTIADDGAGMNPEVLRRKAVEKGMMDEDTAARLTESECFSLIFSPGFSMKQEISDISGRGVGMDVVKTSISKLNGVIDIKSEIGVGTTLSIKVPLTLAIMPTLMVMLGDQIFAFPLVSVNEIFHLDLSKTNVVDGQETIMVRNKALPLFYLRKWLVKHYNPTEESDSDIEHVVIVNVGTQRVGFVVDQLLGQEEVVIKPLGALLHGTKGLAGATITGDGRIALILDFPELMKAYANRGY
ncbi:chemotaxis protein CheA [Methylophaga sp.]|jgi:two-component system chemotaxis sensor kinase CheA|uniref:chemotaxis protein CheA n=1 Tax=Methylophaga sp. TaxID=2024840 RepID=UPI0014014C22|nr:chemotaxis protein CheA [Methylophaga sp.]MTI63160.1 chemotaxis protein CheA [Methylophaga sp.]